MEMTVIAGLIAALWFFYQFLKNIFAWQSVPVPNRTFPPLALAIYCLCAAVFLLWEVGLVPHVRT